MAVSSLVKKIQNIMREDAGVNGNAQRIEQIVWMFFLKIYDAVSYTHLDVYKRQSHMRRAMMPKS